MHLCIFIVSLQGIYAFDPTNGRRHHCLVIYLGKNIDLLLSQLGLTQDQLGTLVGVNQTTIGRMRREAPDPLEPGGPGLFTIIKLADLAGWTLEDFVRKDLETYAPAPASQPSRITSDMLQDAMGLLDELDLIYNRKPQDRPHPARLAIALEVVAAGEIEDGKTTVVRLADKIREWEKVDGNEQGAVARLGAADGGAHGGSAGRKAKVAVSR